MLGTAKTAIFETAMLVVVFGIAAPSWVLAYCKDWTASYVFTATHLKLFSFYMFGSVSLFSHRLGMLGTAELVVFETAVLAVVVRSAEPVFFGTAVLVVVFGLAKFMVFPFQVQLLHWFLHCHSAMTCPLHTCLQQLS
jgi:hypothetical protein